VTLLDIGASRDDDALKLRARVRNTGQIDVMVEVCWYLDSQDQPLACASGLVPAGRQARWRVEAELGDIAPGWHLIVGKATCWASGVSCVASPDTATAWIKIPEKHGDHESDRRHGED